MSHFFFKVLPIRTFRKVGQFCSNCYCPVVTIFSPLFYNSLFFENTNELALDLIPCLSSWFVVICRYHPKKLSQSLSWNSAPSYQFYEAFKNVWKSIIVMCVVLSYPSFNCHRNKEFCLIIFKFLFEIFWNILFTSLFWKLDRTIFKVGEIEIQRITSRGREIFSEFCQFLSEDYSTAEKNRQFILPNIRTSSKSSPTQKDNNAMPGFGMLIVFWA